MSRIDPNAPVGDQEKGRAVHRAQLEAVRAAFAASDAVDAPEEPAPEGAPDAPDAPDAPPTDAYEADYLAMRLVASVRALERRQRRTAWLAGATVTALAVGAAALLVGGVPGMQIPDVIYARSIRADRVAVTGDLRLLDAVGNELAVLGRERGPDGTLADAPVVLALNADGDSSHQTLRLAASKTGAALSLDSPTGDSSLSLLSMPSGPTLELRSGENSRRLSSDAPAAPAVAAGPTAAAARPGASEGVPAWTPRREELPSGAIPEVRDIGHGLLVADLAIEPGAEGSVVVRGRVINTTSVAHAGLGFRVRVGDASGTFPIYRISPGNSTGFSIEIPGAADQPLEETTIEYLGSTVAFQATSTEPLYGRHAPAR